MNDTLGNGTNSSIHFICPVDIANPALQTAMNSLCLILAFPINSYAVWLILSGAGGTITSEFFYLNLSASVIFVSLTSVFYFAWLFTSNCNFLKVNYFAIDFALFSIPLFQCCICVERYIAVVHPVVFLRYKALRYKVACCCVVWLTVLAISIGFTVDHSSTAFGCMYYIILGFDIVCIFVVSFCCFSVLRALKQPGPGEGQRDSGEGNNMKRRAFRIILISLIVMVLATLSYIPFVLTLLQIYSNPVVNNITYAIAGISEFVYPLLYIHKVGKLPCFKWL